MNSQKDVFELLGIYLWVIIVGLVGGLLNIGQNPNKSTPRKWLSLILGVISSMFLGWMSFEVILHFYHSEKLALATCGFFAWKGADWINLLVDKAIDAKLKKPRDEFGYRYDEDLGLPRKRGFSDAATDGLSSDGADAINERDLK